jgi:beta-mannosidase
MTNNSKVELKTDWLLSLSPRPDAWQIEPVKDGHNAWRNDSTKFTKKPLPDTFPATVPGCVHTDLIAAGFIDDISINGKEQDQFWLWKTDSKYTTTIPQDSSVGKKHLIFNGLDTIATISINGVIRLTTKNMHRSYRVDVSDEIKVGPLNLEIGFKAPLTDAEEHVAELGLYPRPYDMPYNYQRKMACSYGWDWGPITITSGIWKKIEIHSWTTAYCDNVAITPTIEDSTPQFSLNIPIMGDTEGLRARFRLIPAAGGSAIKSGDLEIDRSRISAVISAEGAEIWHPRGRGNQPLYLVEFDLLSANGEVIETHSKRIGFRNF